MDYIFETKDVTGRMIKMTRKQWSHIMKKHSYLEKYTNEIKETLKNPDKIVNYSSEKAYYYKNYKHLKSPNKIILIIVKYLNGNGFIITSYLESKIT